MPATGSAGLRDPGAVMRCPQCRHENPGDAKFCLECGRRLARMCAWYATELPAGAKFCKECGTPVDTSASDHLLAAIMHAAHKSRDETRPPTRRMVSPPYGGLRSTARTIECRLFSSRTNRLRREGRLRPWRDSRVAGGAGGGRTNALTASRPKHGRSSSTCAAKGAWPTNPVRSEQTKRGIEKWLRRKTF